MRPAWAHSCGCKSRRKLITASEVKRNCGAGSGSGLSFAHFPPEGASGSGLSFAYFRLISFFDTITS
ncbi:MAG: hypothetical protein EKK55_14090 [Rhodocyclaceae bacterium]|nr:MAG: hypothetical protein EKK55_14090 [Rhodocyclaceae bacterium]